MIQRRQAIDLYEAMKFPHGIQSDVGNILWLPSNVEAGTVWFIYTTHKLPIPGMAGMIHKLLQWLVFSDDHMKPTKPWCWKSDDLGMVYSRVCWTVFTSKTCPGFHFASMNQGLQKEFPQEKPCHMTSFGCATQMQHCVVSSLVDESTVLEGKNNPRSRGNLR